MTSKPLQRIPSWLQQLESVQEILPHNREASITLLASVVRSLHVHGADLFPGIRPVFRAAMAALQLIYPAHTSDCDKIRLILRLQAANFVEPPPDSAVTAPASAAAAISAEPSTDSVVTTPASAAAIIPAEATAAPAVAAPAPASAILTKPPSAPAVITPAHAQATPARSGPDPAPDFAVPSQAKALQLQPYTIMPPSSSPVAEAPPVPSLMQGGGHDLFAILPGMAGSSTTFGQEFAPSVLAPSTSVSAAGFHPHEPVMPSRESFIFDPGGRPSFSWLY